MLKVAIGRVSTATVGRSSRFTYRLSAETTGRTSSTMPSRIVCTTGLAMFDAWAISTS